MIKLNKRRNLAQILGCGTAMVMVTMMAAPVAMAQGTAPAAAPANDDAVIVIGTRKSQQSSIDRKKKAKTATDSIVAEDVGKFPDKNIGEAISRIAGVALGRGDFNEGVEVSLRGNSSSQTMVEIDGLGVQNTSISSNLSFNAGGDSRNKDFRDFPADLIKSVDVVKGSTAAMREGGLGGSIVIQTRTGLDFKKPYLAFSYDASKQTLSNDWTPTFTFIGSRKFLNNKLGILLNVSSGTSIQDNDSISSGGSNNLQGSTRQVDFDNSLEKTFTFNPNTVSKTDPAATTPFTTIAGFTSETPLSLVTKSAAATTKQACLDAFPRLTPTQLAGIATTNQTAAVNQRSNELITCLNQWNDYTPTNIRYFRTRDVVKLDTIDLRADYQLTEHMTVYAKITQTHRKIDNNRRTLTPGGFGINTTNNVFTGATNFTDTAYATSLSSPPNSTYYGANRTANAGSGYSTFAGPVIFNNVLVNNSIVNVVNDSTLVVDKTHHVVNATITDGSLSFDRIHNTNDFKQTYLSTGGTYQKGGLKIDLVIGDAKSDYTRYDQNVSVNTVYGQGTVSLLPGSGTWSITPSGGNIDLSNPALYSVVRPPSAPTGASTYALAPIVFTCGLTAAQNGGVAGGSTSGATPCIAPTGTDPALRGQASNPNIGWTQAQMPWTTTGSTVTLFWQPKINETEEKTAKLDLTYRFEDKIPFITSIGSGFNLREESQNAWANGGLTIKPQVGQYNLPNGFGTPGAAGYIPPYQAPVILPTNNMRTTIRACDDTKYGAAGTAAPAGALSCFYGYVPNTNLNNNRYGTLTLTPTAFTSMISQALQPEWYTFFNGAPDRGDLLNGWPVLDTEKFYQLAGAAVQNYDFSCVKTCTASDGKVYAQPYSAFVEKTRAAYFMADFEQNLPYGLKFNGNVGARYVETDVTATGTMTFINLRCLSASNCTSSTAADQMAPAVQISQPTTYEGSSKDWLPSQNYNLWMFNDKLVARFYVGTVISRPGAGRLLPAGTCTLDQRRDLTTGDACSGTLGNPDLKPFKSLNQNWSFEWYPNKDTQFSYSTFTNAVKISNPIAVGVVDKKVFAGSSAVDPVTGKPLSEIGFDLTTWSDGPAQKRKGTEYAVKSAFTFLPWRFKYLGFDGNYATLHSSSSLALFDPNSGDALPPQGESSYYYNATLWYDDGATNVRVAYQARDVTFNDLSCQNGTGLGRCYPGAGYTNIGLPYNPGAPNFTAATAYLDIKASHKMANGVEVYASIKNAMNTVIQNDQGKYTAQEDGTPSILSLSYPGKRINVGITIRR